MKAITLHEPWATWIAMGHKTIETRTHDRFKCLVGERIIIHAGRTLNKDATAITADALNGTDKKVPPVLCRMSQIVCTVEVYAARWLRAADSAAALCDCRPDPGSGFQLFGIFLRNPVVINDIRAVGHQGVWTWSPPRGMTIDSDTGLVRGQ